MTGRGNCGTSMVCWGAKEGVVAPAAVVFSSTYTVGVPGLPPALLLAMTRSGLRAQFGAPTVTSRGPTRVAKVCWGAKEGVVAPAAVVFSSTDTVADPRFATT